MKRLRFQITTRRLLLLIGIVGVLLALNRELYWRRARDRYARGESLYLSKTSKLRHEIEHCQRMIKNQEAYHPTARMNYLDDQGFYYSLPSEFEDWSAELRDHEGWLKAYESATTELHEKMLAAQRLMIFP